MDKVIDVVLVMTLGTLIYFGIAIETWHQTYCDLVYIWFNIQAVL